MDDPLRSEPGPLPTLHLDELLAELQGRLQEIMATRDRSQGLLEAIVAVGSELDLETVLMRIVEAAVTLVDAEYGALGVLDSTGNHLSQFVTVGIDEAARDADREPPLRQGCARPAHPRPPPASPDAARRPPRVVRLPRPPPPDGLLPRGARSRQGRSSSATST